MASGRRTQTHFGMRLYYLRHRAYLSRAELARRAGLSPDLVQSLEQGRAANPTVRTVFALAGALGLPYGDLMEVLAQDFEGLSQPSNGPALCCG
jgi:transcriptional regulator with XRE-family HTH domain